MNKLELKHLAPYLPYNLKIGNVKNFEKERLMVCGGFNSSETVDIEPCVRLQYKPILRPLGDIVKQIDFNGNSICFLYEIEKLFTKIPDCDDWIEEALIDVEKWNINYRNIPTGIMDKLLEYHFDVFGLIEKGLAIDINTLNK